MYCEICKNTNDFPRKPDGSYEDHDVYIDCDNNVRIYNKGRGVLEAYIPSIQRGRNILRFFYRDNLNKENTITKITEVETVIKGEPRVVTKESVQIIDQELFNLCIKNNSYIFDYYETDEEVLFKFRAKDMELLEKYLKPRTHGANISPFSNKNRPKTQYVIPDEELAAYKDMIKNLPFESIALVAKYTSDFIKSLATKKLTHDDIKSDMYKKGLKGKEYIHSIGKWNEYLKFMNEKVNV